jgi:hypothetical protein
LCEWLELLEREDVSICSARYDKIPRSAWEAPWTQDSPRLTIERAEAKKRPRTNPAFPSVCKEEGCESVSIAAAAPAAAKKRAQWRGEVSRLALNENEYPITETTKSSAPVASVKSMCCFVETNAEAAPGRWRGWCHGEGIVDVDNEECAGGEIWDGDDADLGIGRGRKTVETKSARWPRIMEVGSTLIV